VWVQAWKVEVRLHILLGEGCSGRVWVKVQLLDFTCA
jgi:hypothetical protein